MVASSKIASPDISDTPSRTANVSERTSDPAPRPAAPSEITPRQRWAHLLVLDMINANLPLARLADHLKIPFDTLIASINTPEVQAEINAYEALTNLRARLIGESARPISLRRLLDVLESPAPKPTGRDPESDQRALHRHAELIRRTATTIARESRALAPKAASKPAPRTANVSERTSGPRNAEPSDFAPSGAASPRRAPSGAEPELVHQTPTAPARTDSSNSASPPRPSDSSETSAFSSPVRRLLHVCGSTRARDHPTP